MTTIQPTATASIDSIGTHAADLAMRGAVEYLRQHDHLARVSRDDAALDRLIACLRAECRATLTEAMRDARDALSAGMAVAAETTFAASFRLAGIRAARACVESFDVTI